MRRRFYVLGLMILVLMESRVLGATHFSDGNDYIIDYVLDDWALVDAGSPGQGTHVSIVSGGWVKQSLGVYEDGWATISQGKVGESIERGDGIYLNDNSYLDFLSGDLTCDMFTSDNATMTMSGGLLRYNLNAGGQSDVFVSGGQVLRDLIAYEQSEIVISGGTISGWFGIADDGTATVSGGTFGYGIKAGRYDGSEWGLTDTGVITFEGMGFAINGVPVNYGDYASSYANPINYYGYPGLGGTLTGTLANGQSINEPFYIFSDADIILVPEPSTLLLLGLGAVMLKKRRTLGTATHF